MIRAYVQGAVGRSQENSFSPWQGGA